MTSLSLLPDPWKEHVERWTPCQACGLGCTAKFHVFGRGSLPCDVLFIGEGPGKSEDVIGEPFVGQSGRLLDKWIAASQKRNTYKYFISNVVCCRPCDGDGLPNRRPQPGEIQACRPRFIEMLNLVRPKIVIGLGYVAWEEASYVQARRYALQGCTIRRLYHPAYVLRCGGERSPEHQTAIEILIRTVELLCQS